MALRGSMPTARRHVVQFVSTGLVRLRINGHLLALNSSLFRRALRALLVLPLGQELTGDRVPHLILISHHGRNLITGASVKRDTWLTGELLVFGGRDRRSRNVQGSNLKGGDGRLGLASVEVPGGRWGNDRLRANADLHIGQISRGINVRGQIHTRRDKGDSVQRE